MLVRPVFFNEEIIAIFLMKKSQIDSENDKTPKNCSNFRRIYAFFSQNFDRLCGLER